MAFNDPLSASGYLFPVAKLIDAGLGIARLNMSHAPHDWVRRVVREAFRYDREADAYICPRGATLRRIRTSPDRHGCGTSMRAQYRTKAAACEGCPLRVRCLGARASSRDERCRPFATSPCCCARRCWTISGSSLPYSFSWKISYAVAASAATSGTKTSPSIYRIR